MLHSATVVASTALLLLHMHATPLPVQAATNPITITRQTGSDNPFDAFALWSYSTPAFVDLDGAGQASLTMTDLIASRALAQTIPVQFGTVVQPVPGKGTSAPTSFSLNAASPNPFNPATTISYEVPQSAHIQLTVYNLLGQEVVRLVDQTQQPGRYQITWNALNAQGASVASGVYLYRLTSSTGYSR